MKKLRSDVGSNKGNLSTSQSDEEQQDAVRSGHPGISAYSTVYVHFLVTFVHLSL